MTVRPDGAVRVLGAGFWVVALFLMAPLVVIVGASLTRSQFMGFPPEGLSLRWYAELAKSRDWMDAIRVTLMVALASAVLATSVGFTLAVALERIRPRAGGVLFALGVLPVLLPPVVAGVAFVIFFYQVGLRAGVAKLILAHAVIHSPFPLVLIRSALERIHPEMEEAAMNLGAGPVAVLRTVTVPLLASEVLASLLFAFVLSLNEFIVAFLVSTFTVTTLPIQIFSSLRYSYSPVIAAASTLFIAATFAIVYMVDRFTRGLWR